MSADEILRLVNAARALSAAVDNVDVDDVILTEKQQELKEALKPWDEPMPVDVHLD